MAKKAKPTLKARMSKAAKTNSRRVHVTSRPNGWVVKKEGNKRASTGVVKNQNDAIKAARKMVTDGKASKVVIHKRDGKIRK
jgi:uncharacterized protein YdaT